MKARAVMPAKSVRKRQAGTAVMAPAVALPSWAGPSAQGRPGAGGAGIAPVADEAPGYAVETFGYPGADGIPAERNTVLRRGDGHITLAECATGTGRLEVRGRGSDKVRFRATGTSGWLTLEIPAVHAVRGNDHSTRVGMTAGSEEEGFAAEENTWTPVGESVDEENRRYPRVEIRTTR